MPELIERAFSFIIAVSLSVLAFLGVGGGVEEDGHAVERPEGVALPGVLEIDIEAVNLEMLERRVKDGLNGMLGRAPARPERREEEETEENDTAAEADAGFREETPASVFKNSEITAEGEIPGEAPHRPAQDGSLSQAAENPAPSPSARRIPPSALNKFVRERVVNVFCLSKTSGFFNPLSGSGVIIDEKGVVLTNAHIAQYYLLEDYRNTNYIDCVLRTGSPARSAYRAKLLFFPGQWMEDNAENIILRNPTGTGENDYALLLITEPARNSEALPDAFPALTFAPTPASGEVPHQTVQGEARVPKRGEAVFLASYPAGFLKGLAVTKGVWLITTISDIRELFTFEETAVPGAAADIFEFAGTISAQEGSSGGAVVDFEKGELIGLIVTRTEGETTSDRNLRALSAGHIRRSFAEHTGKALDEFLAGNLEAELEVFQASTSPALKARLEEVLGR